MRHRATRAIASLALLCLPGLGLGCAGMGGSPRPDWIQGSASAYPAAGWVSAAASGSSADSARSSARAELSRVFLSSVESEVRDRAESTVVVGTDGVSRSSVIESLSIDTRIGTQGDFEGVRVVEIWKDPKAAVWHALAVVNKAEMRSALASQLEQAGGRVRSDVARAGSAATPLGRARALVDAGRSSRARDLLVARARVVGAPSDRFEPSSAEIDRQLDEVLWSTRFEVRAMEVDPSTGQPSGSLPRLREALEKRITRIGFRVARGGEDANLLLMSRMLLEVVPRDFEGYFVRWQGSYEVSGVAPDGAVVLSSQGSGGESYSTLTIARTRALDRGAQKLATDLQQQISRYLTEGGDH